MSRKRKEIPRQPSPSGHALEYINGAARMASRPGEAIYAFRPLIDSLGLTLQVKNIGKTTINHFTMRQFTDMKHVRMSLMNPRLPSRAWRPFAGNLIDITFYRDVSIKDGKVTVRNPVLDREIPSEVLTPVGRNGIEPGQVFMVSDKETPYFDYYLEGVEQKGKEAGLDFCVELRDAEKSIVDLVVKEYKIMGIALHDMRVRLYLRAPVPALQEIVIEDTVVDGHWTQYRYLSADDEYPMQGWGEPTISLLPTTPYAFAQ